MIKIKPNSLLFPYFISLYISIYDFHRSAALGIGALETVQKRASTLFPQVKIISCRVRDSIGINKPLKLV